VAIDDVAAKVQVGLESIDIEDVFDRAGSKRGGYVDPGDAAWEMFEEALEPFQEEVAKYKQLSMQKEAELTYLGILKGIYDFPRESSTEYKQWAVDAPVEYFAMILGDWKNLFKGHLPFERMRDFLDTHCPDWAEWGGEIVRVKRPQEIGSQGSGCALTESERGYQAGIQAGKGHEQVHYGRTWWALRTWLSSPP
jgi:hypothetical protein